MSVGIIDQINDILLPHLIKTRQESPSFPPYVSSISRGTGEGGYLGRYHERELLLSRLIFLWCVHCNNTTPELRSGCIGYMCAVQGHTSCSDSFLF